MKATGKLYSPEKRGDPHARAAEASSSAETDLCGFLLMVTILVVFGLTMLYSASYGVSGLKYFRNQLMWVALGGLSGGAAFLIGYRRLAAWSLPAVVVCMILMLIARFCFSDINGAYRWIRLGPMSLQPSEFAKIALALYTAKYCCDNMRTFSHFRGRRGLLPLGVVVMLTAGFIVLGHDLGTMVLVCAMVFLTLVAAGLYLRYVVVPLIGAGLVAVYVYFFDAMRLARVTSFLHPESVQAGQGYQLWTSLIALGSGGWFGVGFMESRMKAKYLPEAHTDFILAIVGEELGFVGMVGLLLVFGLFAWFALRIAARAGSRLGMLTAFALTMGIVLQGVINLAVISGSAPTKGMPMPFISYGGSNLLATLIAVGVIASVAADTVMPGYDERIAEAVRRRWNEWRRRRGNEDT